MERALDLGSYYVVWILTILAASADAPWIATAIAGFGTLGQLGRARFHAPQVRLLLAGLAIGVLADNALTAAGLCRFETTTGALPVPLWMTGLWGVFAGTLRHGLRELLDRPLQASLLGAVGGPLAYLGGQSLGAITLSPAPPGVTPLIAVSFIYAVATPLLCRIAAHDLPAPPETEREAMETAS